MIKYEIQKAKLFINNIEFTSLVSFNIIEQYKIGEFIVYLIS